MKTPVDCIYFALIWILILSCMESKQIKYPAREGPESKQMKHPAGEGRGSKRSSQDPLLATTDEMSTTQSPKSCNQSTTTDCSSHCKQKAKNALGLVCDRPFHVGMAIRIANKTAEGYTAIVHETFTPSGFEADQNISIILPERHVTDCPCPRLHLGSLYLVAGHTDVKGEALHLDSGTIQLIVQRPRRGHKNIDCNTKPHKLYCRYKGYITSIVEFNCPTSKGSEQPEPKVDNQGPSPLPTPTAMPRNQSEEEK